jgi:hypothetical protein
VKVDVTNFGQIEGCELKASIKDVCAHIRQAIRESIYANLIGN